MVDDMHAFCARHGTGQWRILLKKAPSGRELPTESGEGEGEGRRKRYDGGVSENIFAFGERRK